ncbi:MAG: hydrogenase 2 protein HybA [gamma proteobacterium symbiont of Ctena orbiculata]|uniref:Hydrogenase 2 operon protein HybA n=1 Tax=Candidatus Thiodiazotropha taylori TaxID=2792791 RepID=A0A944QVW3_9GAMM|nr:hydrogenase 2 operon protein HybA [Candidatus Thiodiazotropha taylori]PVV09768.1 MAG: hydrogenase 2 protein HybA [gamma proteobacterium symbiont of Ctena orbiculata]MBT2989776.1 hydrogenase 2 operon protein HybA [Candidatus Thiodiazotropha taylori]MBT2995885.1 hydrogenase 2 operon protein HybA [Candidatus Thiodiazotropha taylori]MBT2999200.1 hydrogenase 2 operon protein HybA [Candidatus Thiodiazotropha taylori]
MKRRDFLKASLGGGATLLGAGTAEARGNLEPADEAIGMLYDSTLCIGCKACVSKCKEVNGMPPTPLGDETAWDSAQDLSAQTLNVIKVYSEGEGDRKDAVKDGYAFEKRSCMHCVDPGCVSVCPVTAMRRHPKTGIVTHHPDACIGCRTCMVGCPYNVPQFDYDNPFGEIHKCQMCNQAGVERIDKGEMTGCAEVCPTGATLFGSRKALLEEAKRRMALKPGESYNYPRGDVRNPESHHEMAVPAYQQHVWGEKEAGGTNVLHISSIPFDKLGMPPLEERSYASISETVQHTLYSYMALPAIALAGLTYVVRRNTDDEGGDDS